MTDRPDSPEDAVVEEDECGHGAEAGGQEARPVDVVPDVVGVVAQVGHAVGNLRRKKIIIMQFLLAQALIASICSFFPQQGIENG